jgi:hypothetical protein
MLKEELMWAICGELDPYASSTDDAETLALICIEIVANWTEKQGYPSWITSSFKRELALSDTLSPDD